MGRGGFGVSEGGDGGVFLHFFSGAFLGVFGGRGRWKKHKTDFLMKR